MGTPSIIIPIPTGTVSGFYASQNDLTTIYGTTNVAQWSQLDGSPTPGAIQPNTGKILACLQMADNIINGQFQNGPFTVPLPANPGGLSGASSQVYDTNRWAVALAARALYMARMQRDAVTEKRLDDECDAVMFEMVQVKNGARQAYPLFQRRWPTASGAYSLG